MALLEVKNVSKVVSEGGKELKVLDNVSFNVHKKEFVCLLGASGSGKSTLLRIIAGLVKPTSGVVLFKGRPVERPDPKMSAMIFQTFALLPWRTVEENIEFGMEALGVPKRERLKRVCELVKLIGLEGFEDAYPAELSGGMKQRVGMARALAVEPEILLLDEPFSALDELTAEEMRSELLKIWLNPKIATNTFMMVTHLIEEAVQLADRIIVMSQRPGRVIADVTIPLPRPRDIRSPEFFETCDRIRALMGRDYSRHIYVWKRLHEVTPSL